MKKHIQVEAAVLEGFNKVLVKILAQTHRGTNFGNMGNKAFYASNGIILESNNYPARDKDKAYKHVIYVRGAKAKLDSTTFACTTAEWPKIVAAIKEYNAYEFAAPRVAAPAPRPAVNACAVIIG